MNTPSLPGLPAPDDNADGQLNEDSTIPAYVANADTLEICLDILSPSTLAAIILDHQYYIARHQDDTPQDWGALDLIQQDADFALLHLTDTHFQGDPGKAGAYLGQQEKTHIPF